MNDKIKTAATGAISGGVETLINHPLWALKTRMQCGAPFTLNPKILYRGFAANVGMAASIVSYRFISADYLGANIYGAFATGFSSAFATAPIELVLTYKQLLDTKQSKQSLGALYFDVVKRYGVSAGLTGMPTIACRDGCNSFALFFLAPYLKTEFAENFSISDAKASLAAGISAGVVAAVSSHPFDTIKTLEHAQFKAAPDRKQSTMQIAWKLYQQQGIKGFYRGFGWRATRVVSGTTIISNTAERLRSVL